MKLETTYNPDVLLCLANLSNDEVFTPPTVAEDMLDLLPVELWSDPNAKFLDPVSKSGVFLREIAKKLMVGLEDQIPDLQSRIDHIYTKQLYGIAITELTGLLSRRSLYCSKYANGKYSIVSKFDDEVGNLRFKRAQHRWFNDKCVLCGASQAEYDRSDDLENHAYEFIHTTKPEEIYNMKFDVIIGNPPYQLNDGGGRGTSATPLYQKFVQQAIKLQPRYLTMIIPSRWYSGGKGLDEFRASMLKDRRIRRVVDYFDSTEAFPGVDISGGVNYFLWDRDNEGDVEVTTIRDGNKDTMTRPMLEEGSDSFIRFNEAISILRKIHSKNEEPITKIVSTRKPFGDILPSAIKQERFEGSVRVYAYPKNGFVQRAGVTVNNAWIDAHKVFIAKAYGERGSFPYLVTGKPFIGEPGSVSTETYLLIGPFSSEQESRNARNYIATRFFRFLTLLRKNTQNAAKGVYDYAPLQDFTEEWTDSRLYEKYGLTKDEIAFIESMIRPMELDA